MMKQIAAIVLILLAAQVKGQSSTCLTELGKVMENYKHSQEGLGSYAIAVDIHAVPKDSNRMGAVDRTFEMVTAQGRMRYVSKEMSVFADEKYVANVLHENKVIYLSPAPKEGLRPASGEMGGGLLEKELLKNAKVVACQQLSLGGGKPCKSLTLEVTGGSLAQRGISFVRYLFDPISLEIKETRIDYNANMEDAYVVFRYRKARPNWAPSLDTPVQTILFSKGETLAPAFSGYNLIKTNQQ